MRIGITDILDESLFKRANTEKMDGLIYLSVSSSFKMEQVAGIELYDFSRFKKELLWEIFHAVEKKVEVLYLRCPSLFFYKGYDLKYAFLKELFWMQRETYILEHIPELYSKYFAAGLKESHQFIPLYSNYRLKKFFSVVYLFLQSAVSRKMNYYRDKNLKDKVLVRINHGFLLNVYRNLLRILTREKVAVYQSCGLFSDEIRRLMKQQEVYNFNQNNPSRCLHLSWFSLIQRLMEFPAAFIKDVITARLRIINHVDKYEGMLQSGPKAVLINAAENEGEGIVLGLVARKYGVKSFNYMNGAKGYEPINQYTNFDYWFMHDRQTCEMLASYTGLTSASLPVVGHLSEDFIKAYSNQGTHRRYDSLIFNKKVIAFFSSPSHNTPKNDTLHILHALLKMRDDFVVLIRRHPLDRTPYALSDERIMEVSADIRDKENSLYDFLSLSHMALTFTSTVSMEASFFGLPVFNIEYSEKPFLPFIDGKRIMHISNKPDLEKAVIRTLDAIFPANERLKKGEGNAHPYIAEKIASYLLQ